jgi:hypothetical protein
MPNGLTDKEKLARGSLAANECLGIIREALTLAGAVSSFDDRAATRQGIKNTAASGTWQTLWPKLRKSNIDRLRDWIQAAAPIIDRYQPRTVNTEHLRAPNSHLAVLNCVSDLREAIDRIIAKVRPSRTLPIDRHDVSAMPWADSAEEVAAMFNAEAEIFSIVKSEYSDFDLIEIERNVSAEREAAISGLEST